MQRRNVIVVGAGPVGTVAALACARYGHTVTLLEAQTRIDDSPRASTTQPPTLEILAGLGLIDEYIRESKAIVLLSSHQFLENANIHINQSFCIKNKMLTAINPI